VVRVILKLIVIVMGIVIVMVITQKQRHNDNLSCGSCFMCLFACIAYD
jgi:hypothetical protein